MSNVRLLVFASALVVATLSAGCAPVLVGPVVRDVRPTSSAADGRPQIAVERCKLKNPSTMYPELVDCKTEIMPLDVGRAK